MGMFLLKWFGWYCLYLGIGCTFFALHFITMESGRFCWLFWPDVDVKFVGQRFADNNISGRFCYYVVLLWPFRVIHICAIFIRNVLLWIAMGVTALIMMGYDFGTEIMNKFNFFTGLGTTEKTG